jgi:hypothetical protein
MLDEDPQMLANKSLRLYSFLTSCLLGFNAAQAVDFHAFEFNEGFGSELNGTANTGIPGGAAWEMSNNLTDSFTDGAGNFRIAKFNDLVADNYLQIDNITSATSGSRYIVVGMSGWDFFDSVVGEGEEIRFDFLNDNTGTSGSTVAAQIRIDRNTDNGNIEIRGTAIGVGSSNILSRATLNTTQTNPFTMVLELNKTSNTYEIFYKDGSNPSQFLGAAPVAPDRNGNSIRFTVNNNFGSTIDEFFGVDRIALSDTNPFTDLMTLQIHRTTGEMKLINTTGAALSGLSSYTITSPSGALNAANWKSVTDFYDQAPGNGSVDPDGAWTETTMTTSNLSEGVVGGNGGNLSINQEVILSQGTGPWLQGIYEDLEITFQFDGGITRKANVNFIGNSGKRFGVGDLNFDGLLTVADWTAFNAGGEADLSALSVAQQYRAGDLNEDGENNIFDFGLFKNAYEAVNGLGSFDAMIAAVPEPTVVALFSFGSLGLLCRRHCRQGKSNTQSQVKCATLEESPMKPRVAKMFFFVVCLLSISALPSTTRAAIFDDFQFGDTNGTVLGSTLNSANAAHSWNEDPDSSVNASVLNGKYRIQKNNVELTTHFLNNDNISSGKAWLVAEMSGWNFSSLVGPGEFDSAELEDFRLAFLNNDTGAQGGSTITGQMTIQRNAAGGMELVGRLSTGPPEIGPLPLTINRTTPFTMVLEIDENSENFSVYYKDNTGPFTLLGTAPHQTGRDGNSIRFGVNNNFGGTGEFFDVDRIYLTDTNPTNVSNDLLTLQVNTATGELKLRNTTATTFDIDAYTITSSTLAGDLSLASWSSLSDKVPLVDPVDGPDGDSTLGNGVGETWDEAPGSSNRVLAERFLLGSSVFNTGREISLGNAFQVGGNTSLLSFQYRNADTGAIITGALDFISTGPNGDYDNDGDVDGRDFLRWQRGNSPSPLSATDLAVWQANYGTGGLTALQSVPEPALWSCLLPMLAGMVVVRRR